MRLTEKLVGSTRYLVMAENLFEDKRLIRVAQRRLNFLCLCVDRIVEWARDTLDSTPHEIRRWLRSPLGTDPDRRPFKVPQERSTLKRYVGQWKQFTFYIFRTGLLDRDTREEIYGIRFTEEQMELISVRHVFRKQRVVSGWGAA